MKNSKGFTLVELFLGLLIFSMIALTVYGTFWGGIRLSERSRNEGEIYREIRWAIDAIARDLENAVDYDMTASYPERTVFRGESDSVRLLLPTDEGLKVVRYYLESPEEEKVHEIVIGDVYRDNVDITEAETAGIPVEYLVREEMDFKKFLGSETFEGEIEIIGTNLREDSLEFEYTFLNETEILSRDETWDSLGIPAKLKFSLEFVSEEFPGGTRQLIRHVLVPGGELKIKEPGQ